MTTKQLLVLVAICVIIVLGVQWLRQGVTAPEAPVLGTVQITDVQGSTLPQAIDRARQEQRTLVRVIDPDGNTIEVSLEDPTRVAYTLSPAPEGADVREILAARQVETDKFNNYVVAEDGTVTFTAPMVKSGDIATLVYETSVAVYNIRSTKLWVIELE